MNKTGFIGAGNMSSAIIGGVIKNGVLKNTDIIVYDINANASETLNRKYAITLAASNINVAEKSDVLFICVKPHLHESVLDEIKHHINPNALIIIIAAGISIDFVQKKLNANVKVIKTMPNTPALVGEGMTAICASDNVATSEIEGIVHLFNSIGKTTLIDEELFDAYTGMAGSSPAYAFMFIEALSDAGVKYGLPRDKAIFFAAQGLLGAAKMALETNTHPGSLKDNVCSPRGATIEAVHVLERFGFRNAIIEGASACIEKSIEMKRISNS